MITPDGKCHQSILEEIRQDKEQLTAAIGDNGEVAAKLANDQIAWWEKCLTELSLDKDAEPASIIRKCVAAMEESSQRDFILGNLIEAMKQGKKLSEAVDRMCELGLLPAVLRQQRDASQPADDMGMLQKLKVGLLSFQRRLVKIGANALKVLADKIKIKIRPVVQLAPIPSLGFSFDVGYEEEVSAKELLDLLDPLFATQKA